jgi:hypothetical protein
MFFYLGPNKKGLPPDWFLGTVVVRDLAVVGLCMLVLRHIYRPHEDPVRHSGEDDPQGGPLDGAPDHRAWQPRAGRPGVTTQPRSALASR